MDVWDSVSRQSSLSGEFQVSERLISKETDGILENE